MVTVEIVFILLGGVVIGGVGSYLIIRFLRPNTNNIQKDSFAGRNPEIKTTQQRFEVEKARREYKSIKLEKELHTDALTRVFQAESNGRITKRERELLSTKYRDQIKKLDEKLNDSELIMEANELENLREELLNLFKTKVSQIERRLDELRSRLDQVKGLSRAPVIEPVMEMGNEDVKEIVKEVTSKPAVVVAVEQSKVQTTKPQVVEVSDVPVADEKVKAIKNEVLDALTRLEQMDMEEE